MFFHAHAYYSIQSNRGVVEPLRIFGALLADSALTGTIGWSDLHQQKNIEAFIRKLPLAERPLGSGLMDHYELDLRSHDAFEAGTGYAFSHQTPELKNLVSQACALKSPDKIRGLAHNFIEAGVDINLLGQDKTIRHHVRRAIDAVDTELVAIRLADFFAADAAKTKTRLKLYKDLMLKYNLTNVEGWVALWEEMVPLLGGTIDTQATKQALLLAIKLTAKDYITVLSGSRSAGANHTTTTF